jgi:ligand-binding sensor domain-containing protein
VLWFGTNNGVSRYDGKSWHNYHKTDGLLENNVYAVAAAPNGEIWAGSRRGVTLIGR